MEVLKNNKKVFILIIIVFFIILFKIITNKSTSQKIDKYIEDKGFVLSKDTNIYEKKISSMSAKDYYSTVDNGNDANYSVMYFNTNEFTLLKDSTFYSNGVTSIFDGTFDYKDDSLKYIYEVSTNNSYIMFEGDYDIDSKEFSCDVTYYENINPYQDNNNLVLCEKISYDAADFADEVKDLITNPSLLEKIKKEKDK